MSMTAEQVRFLAERVMGWTYVEFTGSGTSDTTYPRLVQQCGLDSFWVCEARYTVGRAWDTSTSRDDAAELLRAVAEEKRDDVVGDLRMKWDVSCSFAWWVLTATPAQITAAVLAAYGWEGKDNVR